LIGSWISNVLCLHPAHIYVKLAVYTVCNVRFICYFRFEQRLLTVEEEIADIKQMIKTDLQKILRLLQEQVGIQLH